MDLKAKIGLGTVQFGMDYGISNRKGRTPVNEVRQILDYALSVGIDMLDTAKAYGNSENVLGTIGVRNFKTVTKYLPESETGLSVEQQLKASLNSLGLESVYGYLSHRPKDLLDNIGQWRTMGEFKSRGLVGKIGYSVAEPETLKRLLDRGLIPDLIQIPVNYFDRRFEETAGELHRRGCEIHSRSTFLQGLFFRDPESLPPHFDRVKELILEVKKSTSSLASSLLRFVLEKPFIDKVIVGVDNRNQLIENLQNLQVSERLPEKQFEVDISILDPSRWPKN